MLFLFILPYLVASFDFKIFFLKGENYPKKHLFLILIPMFLAGFINPYGIKAITYIFTSFGDKYINSIVNEMHPMYKIGIPNAIACLLPIIITVVVNTLKHKEIKARYFFLQLGTMILGLSSAKGYSFFLIGGVFPLAYYLKDYFKTYEANYHYSKIFKVKYLMIILIIIVLPLSISLSMSSSTFESLGVKKIVSFLDKNENKENIILYTDYDTGSYLEWKKYKVYIDPRAEVFIKRNNKRKDIFKEYYFLQYKVFDIDKFVANYNFTHFIVNDNDRLYSYLVNNSKKYQLLYIEKSNKEDKHHKKIKYYLFKRVDVA